MGRRIPSTTTAVSSINPILSSCLFAGSVFITIAIVAGLCAAHRSRKPSPAHKNQKPVREKEAAAAASPQLETTMPSPPDTPVNNSVEEISLRIQQQLNSPKPKDSPSLFLKSKSKLSSTLSMRLPRSVSFSMSMSKTRTRKDGGKQPKQEDSLWKKTIILGERCKVPNEEDAIIYDNKGNRIAAYPPKTPRSLPVSRSNSLIDQESLPFK